MSIPAISVIIVNYNGIDILGDCLDSLKRQTFRDFEAIVVDNASTDGSVAFVRESFPDVRIIENKGNVGFGEGNNIGIKAAQGQFIALLNNDAKADTRFLESMIRVARGQETYGMWAPKIKNYYSRDIIDSAGLIVYKDGIARGRGRLEKDEGQFDVEEEVFFPSGCACMLSREMLGDIGLFDEDLFLYLEDVDIGLRARIAGWRCMYVPDAMVYHRYSATTKPYSALKMFMVERNRIWVVIKYFPPGMLLMSPFYTILRYMFFLYGMARGKGASNQLVRSESFLKVAAMMVKAYLSAVAGSGRMLKKRRDLKKMKRVDNGIIVEWFRRFALRAREVGLKE